MFGLESLAAPLLGNMLDGALGGLFNQGDQGAQGYQGAQGDQGAEGCHHHHHHHHHQNNTDRAAQDFQMARQDFGEARQDFSQGNMFGGMQELNEANQYMQDGFNQLSGGRGWI
jgi:hypothetical protein